MDSLFTAAWHSLNTLNPILAPLWVREWLTVTGSLTEQLRAFCHQPLTVHVLSHMFVPATSVVCEALQLAPRTQVLQREVVLCDGTIPLVFASSLLPEPALIGHYAELRDLGARPLGHWIFAEPVLKRSEMHYCELDAKHPFFGYLAETTRDFATLWGRKTLFTGTLKPLVVSEFFLPVLQTYPLPNLKQESKL